MRIWLPCSNNGRSFERPPNLDGAPDYTAETFEKRSGEYRRLRARLDAMDISSWTTAEKVDWHLVRAEMNGFEFNLRVLKPWARDPAFYQTIWMYRSDVPAHEGPTHHALTEFWTYQLPLSKTEEQRLIKDLNVIPPLMRQARRNLKWKCEGTLGCWYTQYSATKKEPGIDRKPDWFSNQ